MARICIHMTLLLKIKQATVIEVRMSLVNVVNKTVVLTHSLVHGICCVSFQVCPTASEHKESDSVS
jgi:hypothetical protein